MDQNQLRLILSAAGGFGKMAPSAVPRPSRFVGVITQFGLIDPQDLVGDSDENWLAGPTGEWILDEVCAQLKHWRNAGYRNMYLAFELIPGNNCGIPGILPDWLLSAPPAAGLPVTALELVKSVRVYCFPAAFWKNVDQLKHLARPAAPVVLAWPGFEASTYPHSKIESVVFDDHEASGSQNFGSLSGLF